MEINPAGADRMIDMPNIFSLLPGNYGGTLSWYASPSPDEKHTDGMMALTGTPCGSFHAGSMVGHCMAGAVKRLLGCAALRPQPGVQS